MINRFRNALLLLRSSLAVMTDHPRLAVFPIVIGLITTGLALFFVGPVLFYPTGHSLLSAEHWQALGGMFFSQTHGHGVHKVEFHVSSHPLLMAYLALFYVVSMFIATFLNVAFYHEILAALRGGDVSLTRGLQFAGQRWKSILLWALFAGLVTWLLSLLEQKFDLVGKLVVRLIGLAWSVAVIFAVPVLVTAEGTANPLDVLRRSAGVLSRTWGESLIGFVGLRAAGAGLVVLTSFLWLGISAFLSFHFHSALYIGVAVAVWLLSICLYGYLLHVASQIFRGALYLYAAEGTATGGFTSEMFEQAWKRKKVEA